MVDTDAPALAPLTRISGILGLPMERVFAPQAPCRPADVAELIRLWSGLLTPEARECTATAVRKVSDDEAA